MLTLGIANLTYTINLNAILGDGNHWKRQELAKHTIVHCQFLLTYMASAVMQYAIRTFFIRSRGLYRMDVKRR